MGTWKAMGPRALENLAAARTLLSVGHPLPNAAASRAYYAAYQACWLSLVRKGEPVPEHEGGTVYFRHKEIADLAGRIQVLSREQCETLDYLQSLRVQADYFEDNVTLVEATGALQEAEDLLGHLIREDACEHP